MSLRHLPSLVRWAGPEWTAWYLARRAIQRVAQTIGRRMMRIEADRCLVGGRTVSAEFNTAMRNRERWDAYDWKAGLGEEWTADVGKHRGLEPEQWKAMLVSECLERYMPRGGTILEIGPGAGRWTEYLLPRADRVILADIAPSCLDICRERFGDDAKLHYLVVDPERDFLGDIPDHSVDAVWSYDVFVHINATDTDRYLREIRRVLVPGGSAVIHHTGITPTSEDYEVRFRAQMNAGFFAKLVARNGLILVTQNSALTHHPSDTITVFTTSKPTGQPADRGVVRTHGAAGVEA
jgi:ubiquinone/menaquinone biosynthesis C-methylase UbiE